MHHLSADAFPLKRTIYKELSNKKTIILHCALQPANVGTLDGDDADLRQRPLLAKTNRLSSPIQVQFLNDFLHSGEVQTFAIFEILSARGTKCDLHWLIRSTDDAGIQATGWSLDFKLTHYHPLRSVAASTLTSFLVAVVVGKDRRSKPTDHGRQTIAAAEVPPDWKGTNRTSLAVAGISPPAWRSAPSRAAFARRWRKSPQTFSHAVTVSRPEKTTRSASAPCRSPRR